MAMRREAASENDLSENSGLSLRLVAGWAVVVAAAVVVALLVPADALPLRVLVLAAVVGVYAAVVPDTRATLGTALIAVLVFTGFLAAGYGALGFRAGDIASYTALIGFATVLGLGQRWMRAGFVRPEPGAATPPPGTDTPGATTQRSLSDSAVPAALPR
ncbi:hypothetical protein AB0J90_18330 [Micromonospora sp. NPDC049523]|uniref:hypothetical protein n=1 Tax=Micromonospora sp. NPDC049523 TaxID=3155921 RepID=UPI00342B06FD